MSWVGVSSCPPLVGRAPEVERLEQALADTAAGRGRIVVLTGEAGIGKTRIVTELVTTARRTDATVLRGACEERDWSPAFAPFVEAIAGHATETDPEVLRRDLGSGAPPIARLVPVLREHVGGIPDSGPLQADEERAWLIDAVTQLLIEVSTRAPLVLVVDDLHWADRGSLAVLRHLARFVERNSILLLLACRDGAPLDSAHPVGAALVDLGRQAVYEQIALRGLDAEATRDLLRGLLGAEAPGDLAQAIHATTGGRPFFAREIVLHLLDAGRITREHDRVVLAGSTSALGVPETVRQVIGQRVRGLSDAAQRLLATAAAFDGVFPFDVVADVADLDDADALGAIDDALRAQLIRAERSDETYDFTHALIRQVLYEQWNPSRRTRLHRRIAEAIERLRAAHVASHAATIAQHYLRSATLPGAQRGVEHAIVAAEQAASSHAHETVVSHLRAALELLAPDDPRRARLLGRLAHALCWTAEFEEALELAASAAERIAAAEGDGRAADYLAEVVTAMDGGGFHRGAFALATIGLRYTGERRDATWVALRARDIIHRESTAPDFPGFPADSAERRELDEHLHEIPLDQFHATLNLFVARAALLAPEGALADPAAIQRDTPARFRHSAIEFERSGRLGQAVVAWSCFLRGCAARGDFPEARAARPHMFALAERCADLTFFSGQMIGAEDEWRMAIDEGWDQPLVPWPLTDGGELGAWSKLSTRGMRARIHARMGRVDRALAHVESLLPAIERSPGWAPNYNRAICDAAEALWLIDGGERTAWLDVLARNLRDKIVHEEFRPRLSTPMLRGWVMIDGRVALARVCALQRRYDDASAWFAKARSVLEQVGSRTLRAVVDYDEALMFVRRGEPVDAAPAAPLLAAALAEFRRIGMPGWIRRAEALAEEGRMAAGPPLARVPHPATSAKIAGVRGEPAASVTRAAFRREAEYWTISFRGRVLRLKDNKGLRYLATLLASPGREFHALQLVLATNPGVAGTASFSDGHVPASDADEPRLDAAARAAYERRLIELQEELDEAEALNDQGRIERTRGELEFLAHHLAAATGLGGRTRAAATDAERARQAVRKRINDAIRKIGTESRPLAQHLAATIVTGYFCSYMPGDEPSVLWLL